MAASALAVNYLLQLDDQLSTGLAAAESNYRKFTKNIEKLNTAAEKSVSKALGRMGAMARAFGLASAGSGASLGKASKSLGDGLGKGVEQAVTRALSRLRLRMSASVPESKSAKFNSRASTPAYYRGLPQPADMVGMFEAFGAKKYAQGGLVTGTQGKDKVPALLTAGEWVLTKQQTKDMLDSAGKLRSATGAFTSGITLGKTLTEMKALTIQADKLKAAAKGGMDKEAGVAYARVLKRLEINTAKLNKQTKNLSLETRARLAPALGQVREQVEGVQKSAPKAENWLAKIANHTRFLALSRALQGVEWAMDRLGEGANLGGAADALVTNFQQMNRTLGLSQGEIGGLRDEMIAAAAPLSLANKNVNGISESMQGLVEAKVDKHLAAKLAPAVEIFATATGSARESVADFAGVLANKLKLSAGAATDTLATLAKQSAAAGVQSEVVTTAIKGAIDANGAYFRSLSPEQAQKAVQAVGAVSAAMEKVSPGMGDEVANLFSGAAAGNPEQLAKAAGMFGVSIEQVRESLASGDVSGLVDGLNESLANQDPMVLSRFAENLGVSEDALAGMMDKNGGFAKALEGTSKAAVAAGEGLAYMDARAKDNLTTYEKLRNSLVNSITNTFPDLIVMLKDINFTELVNGFKAVSMLADGLTKLPGLLMSLSSGVFSIGAGIVKLAPLLGGMLTTAYAAVVPLLAGLWGMVAAAWSFTAAMLANPITWIVLGVVAAISAIAAGIYLIIDNWDVVGRYIKIAFSPLLAAWKVLTATGAFLRDTLAPVFRTIGGFIQDKIVAQWDTLVSGISHAWELMKSFASWVGEVFSGIFAGITTAMATMWDGLISGLTSFFAALPAKIWESIKSFATWIGNAILGLIPEWVLSAMNWAGVISDEDLEGIKASQATPVQPPAPTTQIAPGAGAKILQDGAMLEQMERSNALLEKVVGNTGEVSPPVVNVNVPRNVSSLTDQLAKGAI